MQMKLKILYKQVEAEGLLVLDTKEQMTTVVDILLANQYSVIVSAECGKYRLDYHYVGDGDLGIAPIFAEEDWDDEDDDELDDREAFS